MLDELWKYLTRGVEQTCTISSEIIGAADNKINQLVISVILGSSPIENAWLNC
jgi:hypothetical protein